MSESATLLETPLHATHANLQARLVDFAGWSMPVQYGSIIAEHQATRGHVGLFDVSHMGRFEVMGVAATAWLEGVLTRRVEDLPQGRIRYALVTQDDGGILDDVLVYRAAEADKYLLVVNASNRARIWDWLMAHPPEPSRSAAANPPRATWRDLTLETAMIAVQGPAALKLAQQILETTLTDLRYYSHRTVSWRGADLLVSRTGYTGEDGVEIIVTAEQAVMLWEQLSQTPVAGKLAQPAGLGARDTLRLEAALPLYGHELGTWGDPFEAGLEFAVDLTGRSFPGRDALADKKSLPPARRRVGIRLTGRRPARSHCHILHGDQVVGEITSGTFSPTLEQPIAMGYVRQEWAAVDTHLNVDVRGTLSPAQVVPLPFYRRAR